MSIVVKKRRLQGFSANDQVFEKLDLSSMSAFQSKWVDCQFIKCEIPLAVFSASSFERCTFLSCELQQTAFRGSSLRGCRFEECDLRHASFDGCSPIADSFFIGCRLHYSSFNEATVFKTLFLGSNFHGADLRFIEAWENTFEDCVLWGASVNVGCQFFNSKFDERAAGVFTAIASRIHPNVETAKVLRELSGKNYAIASRLMDSPKDEAR